MDRVTTYRGGQYDSKDKGYILNADDDKINRVKSVFIGKQVNERELCLLSGLSYIMVQKLGVRTDYSSINAFEAMVYFEQEKKLPEEKLLASDRY